MSTTSESFVFPGGATCIIEYNAVQGLLASQGVLCDAFLHCFRILHWLALLIF
jgi:hypothetical protein